MTQGEPSPFPAEGELDRLVLVSTTPRVPAGVLSWPAWDALRSGPVFTAESAHPQLPFLRAAGIDVEVLEPDPGLGELRVGYLAGGGDRRQTALAHQFRDRARDGVAVWLTGPDGDPDFVRALGDLVARTGGVEMEIVYGSYDVAGARLLDLVATMDRLRSPGGCPWDAEQTHESLAHYLVEETYEALETIEAGDYAGLRDELGDVLLQIAFHARIAQERSDETGWSIDDVAGGIVDKLVRRHPHVFGDVSVSGSDEVVTNWEAIKHAEHGGRREAVDGVALGQPALSLAAKLQKRAAGIGLPPEFVLEAAAAVEPIGHVVGALATRADSGDDTDAETAVGELLFAVVALARARDVNPEAALRAVALGFRDRLAVADAAAAAVMAPD